MIDYYFIGSIGAYMYGPQVRAYPRHLMLAHLLLENAPFLQKAIDMRIAGAQIILDNGAAEGALVSDEDLLMCARALKPWCIVLPDLVGVPGAESRSRSMDFVESIMPHVHQIMYVPQGLNREGVLNQYAWAFSNLDAARFIIGLGLGYRRWCADDSEINTEPPRMEMLREIIRLPESHRFRYHLLGAMWDATKSKHHMWNQIIGMDTIKPCTLAQVNATHDFKGPLDRKIMKSQENSRRLVLEGPLYSHILSLGLAYKLNVT